MSETGFSDLKFLQAVKYLQRQDEQVHWPADGPPTINGVEHSVQEVVAYAEELRQAGAEGPLPTRRPGRPAKFHPRNKENDHDRL